MASNWPSTPGLGTCAVFSLRRAARLVTRLYEQEMEDAGLSANQFTILAVLAQRGRMRITPLADFLGMERTTLTRDLKPLAQAGFIRIVINEKDARSRLVDLTETGAQKYAEALPLWRAAQAKAFKRLGPGDWPALLKTLATRFETKAR